MGDEHRRLGQLLLGTLPVHLDDAPGGEGRRFRGRKQGHLFRAGVSDAGLHIQRGMVQCASGCCILACCLSQNTRTRVEKMALSATTFRMAVDLRHYYGFNPHHWRGFWSRASQHMVLLSIWRILGRVLPLSWVSWDSIPH